MNTFRFSLRSPVPGRKTKIVSSLRDTFGNGSSLLLIIVDVNEVLKTLVNPPTCPSNCTLGAIISPTILNVVGYLKLVEVVELPTIFPSNTPCMVSAISVFALRVFHRLLSVPESYVSVILG